MSLGCQILVMAKRITLRQMGMCRQMIKPQGSLDYLEIITAERQECCSLLGSNGTKLSIKPQISLTEEERDQLFRSFSAEQSTGMILGIDENMGRKRSI